MNIKELNSILVSWGKFWAARETLQAYASASSIERCRQVLQTGIWASSDKHLFSHQADQMIVPDWVERIDKLMPELRPECRRVINRRYIKNVQLTKDDKLLLWHAQTYLLSVY